MRYALVLLMALGITGCSKKIVVESDTCWDGSLGGSSTEGCGNRTFGVKGRECYAFQKKTEQGFLGIRIKGGSGDEPSTTAAYGVVSGCVE